MKRGNSLKDQLCLASHMTRNARAFSRAFPRRDVDASGLLDVRNQQNGKKRQLTARMLSSYRFLHPLCSRKDGIFRPGSLQQVIEIARKKRCEDPSGMDTLWLQLAQDIHLDRHDFDRIHTCNKGLYSTLMGPEITFDLKLGRVSGGSFEERYGLKGVLAYTNVGDESSTPLDSEVGYVGEAYKTWTHGDDTFAVANFYFPRSECSVDSMSWYKGRSNLAGTLCSISGERDIRIALNICQKGFKVIYRDIVGTNRDGRPIFDYYSFPADDPITGESKYLPCFCPTGGDDENYFIFIRILYELTKTSFHGNVGKKCLQDWSDSPSEENQHETFTTPIEFRREYERVNKDSKVTSYLFQITSICGEMLDCEGLKQSRARFYQAPTYSYRRRYR